MRIKSRGIRWVAAIVPLTLLNGCSSMSNTDKGVATGGLLGAGTGALIGSATRNTGLGAVAGGAIGAVAGGLIGNGVDKAEARADAAQAQQAARQLGITDVATLAQQHISDDVIISQIRTTGSSYHLSPTDIQWLKESGVSDRVIIEMQATAGRPRHVYTQTQVVQPVYVVEPSPPPVSVGFEYRRRY